MKDDSFCKKGKYCDFDVVLSNNEIQVERCAACGKKVRYHKDKKTGRIDNTKYLRDHIRHTAQPFGRTRKVFEEIYGRKRFLEARALYMRKRKKEELPPRKYVKKTGWIDPITKRPI